MFARCQALSLWKKLSFQDWGVDGCLLKLMLSFKKHKSGGFTLALQDLVFVFFRGKWKRAKQKRLPNKKTEGSSFSRVSPSPSRWFWILKLVDHEILPTWHAFGVCSWCFLIVSIMDSSSFCGSFLGPNYCSTIANSWLCRKFRVGRKNLSSIPLCCDCR